MVQGFDSFPTWDAVLAAAVTEPLWYHAPLDVSPRRIMVVRRYKNGKLRCDPLHRECDNFTADASHLPRFLRKVAP